MNRRGFSLIEMLVVLFTLTLMLGFSYTMLHGMFRADRLAAETLERIARGGAVADVFRADVQAATEFPAALGEFRTGPACVILRHGETTWVVYQAEAGVLIRIERAGEGQSRTPIRLAAPDATAEFSSSDGLVRLRVTEPVKHGRDRVTIVEAARGGRR